QLEGGGATPGTAHLHVAATRLGASRPHVPKLQRVAQRGADFGAITQQLEAPGAGAPLTRTRLRPQERRELLALGCEHPAEAAELAIIRKDLHQHLELGAVGEWLERA